MHSNWYGNTVGEALPAILVLGYPDVATYTAYPFYVPP